MEAQTATPIVVQPKTKPGEPGIIAAIGQTLQSATDLATTPTKAPEGPTNALGEKQAFEAKADGTKVLETTVEQNAALEKAALAGVTNYVGALSELARVAQGVVMAQDASADIKPKEIDKEG